MILGLDIAKATFEAVLLTTKKPAHHVFPNTVTGFQALSAWLHGKGQEPLHACMEATGRYGEALATYLHDQGHVVSVVNPMRIKAYGWSRLNRNKTDSSDATLIALFCEREHPAPWSPPPPAFKTLQTVRRRAEAVEAMRQQEENRLDLETDAEVRALIEAHIDYLNQQLATLEQRLQVQIEDDLDLRRQVELLTSIPGIGKRTAHKLLSEVQVAHFDDARSLAAYIGVTPQQRQSGSSVRGRTRLSKLGHAGLRKALFFPAIRAMRCNPVVRAFCDTLRARGKPNMVVVGAAMRKLLHIVFGVLKAGLPFDADHAACLSAA